MYTKDLNCPNCKKPITDYSLQIVGKGELKRNPADKTTTGGDEFLSLSNVQYANKVGHCHNCYEAVIVEQVWFW